MSVYQFLTRVADNDSSVGESFLRDFAALVERSSGSSKSSTATIRLHTTSDYHERIIREKQQRYWLVCTNPTGVPGLQDFVARYCGCEVESPTIPAAEHRLTLMERNTSIN